MKSKFMQRLDKAVKRSKPHLRFTVVPSDTSKEDAEKWVKDNWGFKFIDHRWGWFAGEVNNDLLMIVKD